MDKWYIGNLTIHKNGVNQFHVTSEKNECVGIITHVTTGYKAVITEPMQPTIISDKTYLEPAKVLAYIIDHMA